MIASDERTEQSQCMRTISWLVLAGVSALSAWAEGPLETAKLSWVCSEPVLVAAERTEDPCYSVKDPSIVRYEGEWHLFCTIRSVKRTHQIEYLKFKDWKEAAKAPRHILQLTNNYFCAPQVFYFTPHKKWYMIYQASEETRRPSLQPAYSTTTNIADPKSWTGPTFLYPATPENIKAWIDFWVICDGEKAHLFFTSNNGLMWRAETGLQTFPFGWSKPEIVLRGDIFEANHVYRLRGANKFLNIIESIGEKDRRYYNAYIADKLDGVWKPLANSRERSFASLKNVKDAGAHWTDSFSHGEMLRAGYDERLEIQPENPIFLFQGVSDEQRAGKPYGQIPWKLGLLSLRKEE
jgi:hypothetical protein